jgi:hypothetical protein
MGSKTLGNISLLFNFDKISPTSLLNADGMEQNQHPSYGKLGLRFINAFVSTVVPVK